MKQYNKIREFTPRELQEEIGEYFENEYTRNQFPKLATTQKDLEKMIKLAPKVHLTPAQLMKLENSDVSDILKSANPYSEIIKMARRNKRNVVRIFEGIATNKTFPTPIVIKKGNRMYLMGGNTRISAFAALNMSLPVRIITHPRVV